MITTGIDNSNRQKIINSTLQMAEHFLLKMGSFYPFCFIIRSSNELSSVGGWLGSDYPESQELINFLSKTFRIQFDKKEIKLATICIDIFIVSRINGIETKQDAIEIRLSTIDTEESLKYTYSKLNSDKIEFKYIE